MDDEWIEVGWVTATPDSARIRAANQMLDLWLVDHELGRSLVAEDDVRYDLVYSGPGGGCDLRILVRRSAVEPARNETRPADPMLQYLADLEGPMTLAAPYDPVELVRYALSWPTEYWPGLALRWLEHGLTVDELIDDLLRFEGETHRPQSQRHRARALRKASGG